MQYDRLRITQYDPLRYTIAYASWLAIGHYSNTLTDRHSTPIRSTIDYVAGLLLVTTLTHLPIVTVPQ
jgi:hypothetical protein